MTTNNISVGGYDSIISTPQTTFTIKQPRGLCPTHGEVDGQFHAYVTNDPDYRTPNICPKCYVDWVGMSVQAVTPIEVSR